MDKWRTFAVKIHLILALINNVAYFSMRQLSIHFTSREIYSATELCFRSETAPHNKQYDIMY